MGCRLGGDAQAVGLGAPDELDAAGRRQVQQVDRRTGEPRRARCRDGPSAPRRSTASRAARTGRSSGPRASPRPRSAATTSQCWASTTSRSSAYSSARRISSGSCTPVPSSVNRCTPTAASSASGDSCSPSRPIVIEPDGRTSHSPASSPWRRTNSTTLTESWVGLGVGHRHDARVAAQRGRTRPGLDRLGFLLARLAEVGVQVDEAGRDDAARGVEHGLALGRLQRVADLDDDAVVDRGRRRVARRSDRRTVPPLISTDVTTSLSRSAPLPSRSNSTAIRTAMPLVTCWVITEPGSSDGSTAISTPRFIGPGCMISACSGSRRARCGGEAEPARVLAQARHERLGHPLALHAQQVDHVEVADDRVEVGRRPARRPPAAAACAARRA